MRADTRVVTDSDDDAGFCHDVMHYEYLWFSFYFLGSKINFLSLYFNHLRIFYNSNTQIRVLVIEGESCCSK